MTLSRRLLAVIIMTLATSAGAKDLGTWGNVFEPAEQDMLVFIRNRLKAMEQSGELDTLKNEAIERVKRNAVRPPPVAGLSPAIKYRSFSYDPTFTVNETVTDMKGNIIARKGDQVNPLDRVPYHQTLYFIDGDNRDEVAWMKKQLPGAGDFKVILVKGNIKETSDALDERIYFDQAGVLTTKFGFEHTPVRITRDNRVLKVEEIPVTGVKK
ncbi:IncF plasmid conjugative transfer pilus assembly protein TraW [Kosakonia radicincitans]|uniref:type-F conjugative transfer system protein TraW n=1 Tax=Kosakonia radicincitans TaxID=283686 RepID=UPI0011844DAF|nr:type-F conjugative transfer system protein TraW [Kosakonia radicincitans]VVT47282.1 IncF plasmid conjugative transfer pilus assembly protein TraW [Kosakonia radicincitans]